MKNEAPSSRSRVIYLINQYASAPETGPSLRHHSLGKQLVQKGCEVYIITASFTHLSYKKVTSNHPPKNEVVDGVNFVWLDVPDYNDSNSKLRVYNWFLFAKKLFSVDRFLPSPPDVVLFSSPSPIAFLAAERLAKRHKARLIFEVRDIWPLSICEIGGLSERNIFIRFLQWIEDRAYRQSDLVVSNLKYSVDHMSSRGMALEKFKWIPNGFLKSEIANVSPLSDRALTAIPSGKFLVGYTGSIGQANALGTLLEAAKELLSDDDVAFILVGEGREKLSLKKYAKENGLSNVHFLDAIPKSQVQSMIAKFDVCYLGLTKDPLFRFGVSPNKLFDYFYAAKPIIYAIDSGRYRPVEECGAGLQVPPQKYESVVDAIRMMRTMSVEERDAMGRKGREMALRYHEYGSLADDLFACCFGEVGRDKASF